MRNDFPDAVTISIVEWIRENCEHLDKLTVVKTKDVEGSHTDVVAINNDRTDQMFVVDVKE